MIFMRAKLIVQAIVLADVPNWGLAFVHLMHNGFYVIFFEIL